MRSFIRQVAEHVYKPFVQWRISKPSVFNYKNITLHIPAGVFHPAYFNSTLFLVKFMESLPVKHKDILELGCGSGLLSCVAAQMHAHVLATDINPLAVAALSENVNRNNLQLEIMVSDVFDAIPDKTFDYIFINPPYYPKDPQTDAEKAWYCGADYYFFKKLFLQLNTRLDMRTTVFMTLSRDCPFNKLQSIAGNHHLKLAFVTKKDFWNGTEQIYRVQRI